jgi:iron complex transport system ATP-binding protein
MIPATAQALTATGVTVEIESRRLVDDLELGLRPGEIVALLGMNGAGKTLLLHTLAGLRPPGAGHVRLFDADIEELGRRDIAKRLAVLPQDSDDVFPASVLETVLVGRHPHVERFGWETDRDRMLARNALAAVGLDALADRNVLTLSGGERQRLAIAQCIAQDADVMLLDEPTNHLDPHHQLDTLELFRALANGGKAVLMTLHDVNFAARYADRCLLLFGDGRWELGPTEAALSQDTLERLYGVAMDALPWNGRSVFVPALR